MADTTTPSLPTELTVTLTFKIRVENEIDFRYYTSNDGSANIADLFDILNDMPIGELLTINDMTLEDVRKKLQASTE